MLSILFLFVGLSTGNAQQSPQAIFDQANQQLESHNYQQAISLYQKIEDQQAVSGALFLNLGISFQRLDSLGKAKYYFMKASRFDATENQAMQALEFVENQFTQQSSVLPKLPWDVATNWLQQNIGSSTILAISILLLNLGILLYIMHWFISGITRYLNISGLTIIGLAILMLGLSFYTQYVSDRYSEAVMVTRQAAVYEQPNTDASWVSQSFEGYTFTVDHYKSESTPGWKYVRMSNGLYGWIPTDEIMVL